MREDGPFITEYDIIAGDGDCGTTLKSAAEAILAALRDEKVEVENLVGTMSDVASVLEECMGGTGGALYTIYFSAISTAFEMPGLAVS